MTEKPPPRIAVLTREGAGFGVRLLEGLLLVGLAPACIGIERVTWSARFRRARVLARRTSLANAVYHNARIWSRVLREKARGEELPRLPQRRDEGRQCFLMPPLTARRLRARWAAGERPGAPVVDPAGRLSDSGSNGKG